jgi:transcriptional regulator with XRE-family HTH domain
MMLNKKFIKAVNNLELKHSVSQISKDLSVSKGTVSSYYSGNIKASDPFLEKFANFYKVPLESLKDKNESENSKPTLSLNNGRPFYDTDFTLGFEELDNDVSIYPEFNIDFPPANKEGVNWFRGKGNSMLGEINSGDYIALEEIQDFSWFPLGRIYGVVTKNGFRTIKRITKSEDNDSYSLVSSNPDKEEYPDQDIPKNIIQKLFKVVFVIKDLDE